MKEQLQLRLDNLRTEFDSGQKLLSSLQAKQAAVRETLFRISGAIQVLEELLQAECSANGEDSVAVPASRDKVRESAARIST